MFEAPKTKKGCSTRELAGGWGILLLAAPFIGFALIMSLIAVGITLVLTLNGTLNTQSAIFMGGVYALCAFVMFGLVIRILRRSTFLAKRLYRLRQEQQRIADLPDRDIQRLSLQENDASDGMDDIAEEQQRYEKSGKLKDES